MSFYSILSVNVSLFAAAVMLKTLLLFIFLYTSFPGHLAIFWQKVISLQAVWHQHTHLSVWRCCHPSTLSPTVVKRDHHGVQWNTIRLTKYPCPDKQFSRHNGTSECAWFSQCVIPSVDDLPFSSSLPVSALLKLPGEEQTQALLSGTHIWTLQNTQGLHCHANSHSRDLQMDFYLFSLSGVFSPSLWTIQCLLESSWSTEGTVIHPVHDHYFCYGYEQSVFWHLSWGNMFFPHALPWYGHI